MNGSTFSLDGFDPLAEGLGAGIEERTVFEEATKRIVLNILKSYTGYFDLFSELIQNALDALDGRAKVDEGFKAKLKIEIDVASGRVAVIDNGIGMNEKELRYCFRPSVSFKSRKESRGHKGVGATFLGYGFTNIQVHTKKAGDQPLAVQLSGGRDWAEDFLATHSRPKLEVVSFSPSDGMLENSGTRVEIIIGKGNRPDLTWWGATNAKQWLEVLRMRTPLGGVYLSGKIPPRVEISVEVSNAAGDKTELTSGRVEYPYPHEFTQVLAKIKSVREVQAEVKNVDGDSNRIANEFKNLSAMYDIWTADQLLDEEDAHWGKTFEEDDARLIRLHDVSVYGCFYSTAKSWTQYQTEVIKVRKTPLLMKGGLQIASDFMVQGDLMTIPLTSTIGYQANTHVVVHFRDGNPDMGRKVFQPEIKALSEKIARQIVNIFKRYLYLMREDTGMPPAPESDDLWFWLREQEDYQKENPFEFVYGDRHAAYLSTPHSEQDVIALFHELIGIGIFPGLKFLATSGSERYDCCFRTHYLSNESFAYDASQRLLGVSRKHIAGRESKPMILEFKYGLDALIADFEKEVKFIKDIQCVVCWELGEAYQEQYRLISLMIDDEGANRSVYGATHALFYEREKRFEVICLKDLLNYLRDPSDLISRHKAKERG